MEQLHAVLCGQLRAVRHQAAHQYKLRTREQAIQGGYQPSLFETNDIKHGKERTRVNDQLFILDQDLKGDGVIDVDDLQWDYLDGDGDFRSKEIKRLRDEADICP